MVVCSLLSSPSVSRTLAHSRAHITVLCFVIIASSVLPIVRAVYIFSCRFVGLGLVSTRWLAGRMSAARYFGQPNLIQSGSALCMAWHGMAWLGWYAGVLEEVSPSWPLHSLAGGEEMYPDCQLSTVHLTHDRDPIWVLCLFHYHFFRGTGQDPLFPVPGCVTVALPVCLGNSILFRSSTLMDSEKVTCRVPVQSGGSQLYPALTA